MRRREELDPVVARELAAIDAALAGRPGGEIAPEDAELAQLATLLVAERPTADPAARARLDARAAARFAGARPRAADAGAGASRAPRRGALAGLRARLAGGRPTLPALATLAVVALVALVVVLPGGGGGGGDFSSSSGGAMESVERSAPGSSAAGDAAAPEAAAAPEPESAPSAAEDADGAAVPPPVDGFGSGSGGRKIEQSATVELGAPAARVDEVAAGVLDVVARHDGIVDQSSVATGGTDGRATFALRIPAARLRTALAELSRLPDAHVLSRTDESTDVNQAYVSVRRKLDGAEAERAGLLTALRETTDTDERERVSGQLDAVEQRIAGLERAQRELDRRVDYSRVDLTVRADDAGAAQEDDGGAFTPGAALDDAGRLLSVTAGVVVIVAAALVPVALLALLGWPLARAARRRRREHALDGA